MDSLDTRQKKLNNISLALQNKCSEFGCILLYSPRVAVNQDFICKTDGKIIKVGTKFFDLPPYKQVYKILHIALHVGLRHHYRAKELSNNQLAYTIWNIATDLVINECLKDYLSMFNNYSNNNDEDIPTITSIQELLDKLNYDDSNGHSAERLFTALIKGVEKNQISVQELPEVDDDFSPNEFEDSNSVLDKEGLTAEQDGGDVVDMLWNKRIEDSLKKAGNKVGKSLMGLLEHLIKPKVNWQAILRQYLTNRVKPETEPDYRRPSRRNLAGVTTIFEPNRVKKKGLKTMVVCLDTSGSCWCSEVISKFVSNVEAVHNATGCELIVITFDSDVQDIVKVKMGARLSDLINNSEVEIHGGGGTSFIEPINKAMEYNPSVIAVFTDCYGPFGDNINVPTIWASIGDSAPWGKTILIED